MVSYWHTGDPMSAILKKNKTIGQFWPCVLRHLRACVEFLRTPLKTSTQSPEGRVLRTRTQPRKPFDFDVILVLLPLLCVLIHVLMGSPERLPVLHHASRPSAPLLESPRDSHGSEFCFKKSASKLLADFGLACSATCGSAQNS